VIERALILHPGERLGPAQLREPLAGAERGERDALADALERADGDKRRAAELLGVSYRTLARKVRQHDLEGFPRYRR
jgi:transcriptional regulator of acetoin/glycerol metabolism